MKTKIFLLIIAAFLSQILLAQTNFIVQASYTGKPIVEMTINGKSAWVLLDTGSEITILNTSLKKEFGFDTRTKVDENLKVPGFGSKANQLLVAYDAKIEFGDTWLNSQLYAFDLSTISKSTKRRTGKEITAIVGTDLMRKYGFILDLKNGTATMPQRLTKRQAKQKANSVTLAGN